MSKKIKISFFVFGLVIYIVGCQGFGEQLLYNKAGRLHDQGRYEEAIAIYKKLLDSDPENKIWPDNAMIIYDLGIAYLDTHNFVKAREQINALRKLKRDDMANELENAFQNQNVRSPF